MGFGITGKSPNTGSNALIYDSGEFCLWRDRGGSDTGTRANKFTASPAGLPFFTRSVGQYFKRGPVVPNQFVAKTPDVPGRFAVGSTDGFWVNDVEAPLFTQVGLSGTAAIVCGTDSCTVAFPSDPGAMQPNFYRTLDGSEWLALNVEAQGAGGASNDDGFISSASVAGNRIWIVRKSLQIPKVSFAYTTQESGDSGFGDNWTQVAFSTALKDAPVYHPVHFFSGTYRLYCSSCFYQASTPGGPWVRQTYPNFDPMYDYVFDAHHWEYEGLMVLVLRKSDNYRYLRWSSDGAAWSELSLSSTYDYRTFLGSSDSTDFIVGCSTWSCPVIVGTSN